jgi:hypothetical protein
MGSKHVWLLLVAGVGGFSVAGADAQPEPPAPPPEDTVFFLSNAAPLPAFGGQIDILRNEGDVLGAVVEDRPYSARSITESTQTLADGNRITQRNEARIYRDSQGRTRREQTLGGVGPWQAGEPVTMITINDPVADKSYVLDPVARTARELKPFRMAIAHGQAGLEGAKVGVRATWNAAVPAPPPPSAGVTTNVTVIRRTASEQQDVQVITRGIAVAPSISAAALGAYEPAEDLGEQILEGLLVAGTRLTDTIPAGALGNERPIEIVTERWYSKDIDAVVEHRFMDPRFGETIYRLVNVARGEPSPDLFAVPQGYEIEVAEGPQIGFRRFGAPAAGERIELELQRVPVAPGAPLGE